MCGIVGYIGYRNAYPILIKGLHRLKYRGYDSAGVALLDQELVSAMWLAHQSHASGVYTHAGPRIGVAFTAQVTVLTLIAFYIAQLKGTVNQTKLITLLTELNEIPDLIE